MTPDLQQLATEILADAPTLALATVDDAGNPHAANVNFYADDALNLYWISHPDSAHSQHIAARPTIASVAYPLFEGPSEIRGVQLHGTATVLPPEDFDTHWPAFITKFPFAEKFESRARSECFYRLTPTWLRVIDNRRGFGFKLEAETDVSEPRP